MEALVVGLLQAAKSSISNPESFMAKQEGARRLEELYVALLRLIVTLYLVTGSNSASLSPEQLSLLQLTQDVSERANILRKGEKGATVGTFNQSVKRLLAASRERGVDESQDTLQQATDVFIMSLDAAYDSDSDGTNQTRFQSETMEQLFTALEETLVYAVLRAYSGKVERYSARTHAGLSKNAHKTFQYILLLEKEVIANGIIRILCTDVPGFRAKWSSNTEDSSKILNDVIHLIPNTDHLQYYNMEASHVDESGQAAQELASLTSPRSYESDSEILSESSDTLLRKKKSSSKDKDRASSGGKEGGSDSSASVTRRSSGRRTSKPKVAPNLVRKPSFPEGVDKATITMRDEKSKELHLFLNLPDNASEDVDELDVQRKATYRESTQGHSLPSASQIPMQLKSFFSVISYFSSNAVEAISPTVVRANQTKAEEVFRILIDCNMWASGMRISQLPPSQVDKHEVQLVEQNYMTLSKPLEITPDTAIFLGCRSDGLHCVLQQCYAHLRESGLLLLAISTQIMSLFNQIQTNTVQQPFLFLQTCLQRLHALLVDYLKVQQSIVLLQKDPSQETLQVDRSPPLWEETRTRNKFDVESPKLVTKASLNSLVEALTDPVVVESEFNAVFFLTYRSFVQPQTLLHKLIDRFHVPPEWGAERERIQFRAILAIREMIKVCVRDSPQK